MYNVRNCILYRLSEKIVLQYMMGCATIVRGLLSMEKAKA